ncbi:uncharacterized protein LOC144633495 [Oculina patagonica]
MEEKPDRETTARKELEQCELLIKKNMSIGQREHVHANIQVDWHIINCYDKIDEAVKNEFQSKQFLHLMVLEKGCSGSKSNDRRFWDKIFTQNIEELKTLGIKSENIEWADLLCKKIWEHFQIKLFASHFPLYGYMYSKSEESSEVFQWQVVAGAVGWYQDGQGMERYVIVEKIKVLDSPEFWAEHPDAYGKCLHQCLVHARLLQLHLKLEYLPHILIIPISGKTGQDIYPGLFFDYPEKCKEVIESFEWTAGLPKSPSNSFFSRFLTEFQHDLLLGKGGFGVVVQVRHRVDDCTYAIKRIGPFQKNCDKGLEDFMSREVKALAKLEHPSIVRYFTSWIETPPVGWKYETDVPILQNGTSSFESSTDSRKIMNVPLGGEKSGDILDDSAFSSSISFASDVTGSKDSGVSTPEKLEELGFTSSSHYSLPSGTL